MNKKHKTPKMSKPRKVSSLHRKSYKSIKEMQQLIVDNPNMLILNKKMQRLLETFGKTNKTIPTNEPLYTYSAGKDARQHEYTEEYVIKMRDEAIIKKAEDRKRFYNLCSRISIQMYGVDIFEMRKTKVAVYGKKQFSKVYKRAKYLQFNLSEYEKLPESKKAETVYESLGKTVEKQLIPKSTQTLNISPEMEEYVVTKSRSTAMKIVEKIDENINKVITMGRTTYSNAA